MKKIVLPFAAAAFLVACNNEKKSEAGTGDSTPVSKPAVELPYKAAYSSSFEMGSHQGRLHITHM